MSDIFWFIGGRVMYVWWFSPLLIWVMFFWFVFFEFRVGENTQGSTYNYTLVLPSLNAIMLSADLSRVSCRGEYTGEEIRIVTLVLPSLNRFFDLYFLDLTFCRGDIVGEEIF